MNTSKQINIMILLVFVAVIAAGAYTIWDPTRASEARTRQLQLTLDRGAYLFAQNCRACHGDAGEGGAKGNRLVLAPPLNRLDLQGRKTAGGPVDLAAQNAAYKLVFNTITCGRVGKAMPTWGDTQGGPLNAEQITDLTIFITNGTAWGTADTYANELSNTSFLTLTKALDSTSTVVAISNVTPLAKDTYIKIDNELMDVTAVDKSAGTVTVQRPSGNTKAAAHKAGAEVLVEPPILDPTKVAITQPACGQLLPPVVPTTTGPAGTPTAVPTPAANAQKITIVGENILFDKTAITANATAPITITFDNKDAGVPHNIQFFNGNSNTAPSIGMTEIATGPVTQTLSLGTLKPGTYYYQCDVHPTTMYGTLTVK